MKRNDRIDSLLSRGVDDGVFPGAVLVVSADGRREITRAIGSSSLFPESSPMALDTLFDLASLTKPLATSLAFMKLVDSETADLDSPLGEILGGRGGEGLTGITLRLLLSHSAGLRDWKPFYLELQDCEKKDRKKVVREQIIREPKAYRPGEGCVYSDLGFMILEWIIEEISGRPMHRFLEEEFFNPLSLKKTFFTGTPSSGLFEEKQFAATEDCPWRKRIIRGEVHDENAFSLGGYSGHAGLFGCAEEVYALADMIRGHFLEKRSDFLKPRTVRTFLERQEKTNGSTWALGWDTPSSENSSSGRFFSRQSVGHLGFTGTSLWMDLDKDVVVVFLTNRIHPTRNNDRIRAFRPRIHDLVMEELGKA